MNKFHYQCFKEQILRNPVLGAALENEGQVTHVVTYVEYGSQLKIELEYEGERLSKLRGELYIWISCLNNILSF